MSMVPGPSTVQRALSAHAAMGLLAGALLYIVCLTGSLLVFYEEWQRIEQPAVPELAQLDPDAAQRAVEAILATEAGKPQTHHLYLHMPEQGLPRATAMTDTQAFHVDARGALVTPEEIEWSDFLYGLHYTLELPSIVGITIVGALGVMILALSISGVLAHPRIFRDAFRLRARDGASGIALADWHNRLGVWTLPFAVAIALTGAVIGLATLTAYGMAARYYGGDIEAAYAPIFGEEGTPDETPAPAPDIASALRYMKEHYPEVEVTYVTIHDPLTAGQHVQLVGEHHRRLIFGEYYVFDSEGRFQRTGGLADGELGQQAAASTYNLHFGNFGGLPVKIAYALLGLALTAICATGAYIWLGKRRRRGHDEPRLTAAWDAVVWGSPLVLALTFITRKLMGNSLPFASLFWGLLVGLIVVSIVVAKRLSLRRPMVAFLCANLVLAVGLAV